MARPRKSASLPSYCYRDKRNGAYYLLLPAPGGKLKRQTFGRDLDGMLAAWRSTWGSDRSSARTLGDLLDAYLADTIRRQQVGELSPTTAADYRRCIDSLRPIWERVEVASVDAPMLYEWHEARGEGSRTRANRELSVLAEAFTLAVRRGWSRDNPVKHVRRFSERPRDRYVTDADFAAVYAVAGETVRAAMLLATVTGLRQGDILRLRRDQFGESGLIVLTSKTGKALHIGWSPGLRLAVIAAAEARPDMMPPTLLCTAQGRPLTSDGFRTLWHRAMTTAVDSGALAARFTFHDLRAKAGSEARDWRLLGHSDERTFRRVYDRLPTKVAPSR